MSRKNKQIIYAVIAAAAIITVGFGIYSFVSKNKEEVQTADNRIPSSLQSPEKSEQTIIAVMKTNFGDIVLELFERDAPKTVENFIKLSESGFYDGTKFHRAIRGFMIQGGDPLSKDDDWSDDGRGGPDYTFPDEINQHKIVRGILAMANAGPDTNGSQFFIVTAEATPWLDAKHTAFGKVIRGMEVVTLIENIKTNQNDHPLDDAVIETIGIQKM